jgi:Uma2 family endonuclease
MIRQLNRDNYQPWTAADLHARLGDIPLYRIRTKPEPGTATEKDLLALMDRKEPICELIDGTLVEKDMGSYESFLAMELGRLIGNFAEPRKLGFVLGEEGPYRLPDDQVRVPDVSFVSCDRLKLSQLKREPILTVAPDMGIEVISRGNTEREMERKLKDYFAAGIRLVWFVYPRQREVHVYTSMENCSILAEKDVLDGGAVLPGFTLPLVQLFGEPDEQTGPTS